MSLLEVIQAPLRFVLLSLRRLIELAAFFLSIALVTFLWNTFGLPVPWSTSHDSSETANTLSVVRVIDGDTVDLDIAGEIVRVRLIGIDTPETVSRSVPVQCYGPEASTALHGLLPVGTAVRGVKGPEARDRYGRLLLYLYRDEDDLFINEWLVEKGYAEAVSYEPNTAYEAAFKQLRNSAKQAKIGLWGACDGPDQPLE